MLFLCGKHWGTGLLCHLYLCHDVMPMELHLTGALLFSVLHVLVMAKPPLSKLGMDKIAVPI